MRSCTTLIAIALAVAGTAHTAMAEPVAGGTLDPLEIPKYVEPLIIPPVMPDAGTPNEYAIEVVEFRQQILPRGMPTTRVWSYGAQGEPDTYHYPAFTVEAEVDTEVSVTWINSLVDDQGNALPHLLRDSVDQTVHWANPPRACADGEEHTDCKGWDPTPYRGPVPIVTHVHGAHVGPESDGYPEAWWLPAANDIPAGYATSGTLFDDATGANPGDLGYALFTYPNTQRATTLWYHDHTLGMTRLNVYAGPAGFWLIRGAGGSEPNLTAGTLPGPAPRAGEPLWLPSPSDLAPEYRELPIVIQDRSFNRDGSLFYPSDRAFFEGIKPSKLRIDFAPESDVLPIWNPEAFFNTMVVNGRTWPYQNVEPVRYRLRLLNGCNSRFLNLSLFAMHSDGGIEELPFYVIGTDGGLLPNAVRVRTGERVTLQGNGHEPLSSPDPDDPTSLLLAPAERMDVVVDFSGLAPGTVVRMLNTAPDAPFGGFPDVPADATTSGQVMEFVVVPMEGAPDTSSPVADLRFERRDKLVAKRGVRALSLNEEESLEVCVRFKPDGSIVQADGVSPPDCGGLPDVVPFGPTAALLGTYDPATSVTTPHMWSEAITENPQLGDTETWEFWNFTADAHPIHLHLVQFQVVDRAPMGLDQASYPPEPWERGWKDTVIAYPGEVTRVRARFDLAGLYVWHCHIVEHEDNEMMRPFFVGDDSCSSPVPVAGQTCP